jgi:hypothetical protein
MPAREREAFFKVEGREGFSYLSRCAGLLSRLISLPETQASVSTPSTYRMLCQTIASTVTMSEEKTKLLRMKEDLNLSHNIPKSIPKDFPKNISKNIPKTDPKNDSKNDSENDSKNNLVNVPNTNTPDQTGDISVPDLTTQVRFRISVRVKVMF